jgi:hypothetical protein
LPNARRSPMTEPSQDLEQITLEADLVDEDAER